MVDKIEQMSRRDWRRVLSEYQQPARLKSMWQLINTLIPFFFLWYLAVWSLDYSYWVTVPAVILLAGFMVRIFIIFHDCGHGSFFRSRQANDIWGTLTGLLTLTPYHFWRARHSRHHGTSGNLDQRGLGDIWMMTKEEYSQAPRALRIRYRIYRNPVVLFLFGPLAIILIINRWAGRDASRTDLISVHATNVALVGLLVGMTLWFGWQAMLLVALPAVYLAHVAGVWLFYVQHQFEGVYWKRDDDWDFVSASLDGGSFYRLPAVMRWFSGSIGFHHIHHLNSRIPNYSLARCQSDIPALQQIKPIGLRSSLKSLRYRLWDEESGQLVGYR